MTPGELLAEAQRAGRLVLDAEDVAEILAMSRWSVYDLVRRGEFPIEAIRLGRRVKFRTADVVALVGDPHICAVKIDPERLFRALRRKD